MIAAGTERAHRAALAGATLLCLLPFVGKAFHIDDPLFLWVAQQIAAHPFDPFGFNVNWTLTQQPISEITKNPPLASYGIAAAASLVGWSETALHLVFLLPALLAVLGTYELARRTSAHPLVAGLAALLTPAFLVCSTGVTCDTPMLALWVWSIVLWHDGLERKDAFRLAGAMTLVAACALTKYFGMALIPLLSAFALARREPARRWAGYLAIPAAALAGYQLWTQARYGRGLLLDAAAYATNWRAGESTSLLDRGLVGLVFAGGCALTALTFALSVWSKRVLAIGAVAAIAGGALVGLHTTTVLGDAKTAIGVQAVPFLAGGLAVLALAVDDLRRRRDAASLLLFLWVGGVFVFAAFVNWTINGRSILPMVPAVGILLARRLETRSGEPRSRAWIALPLAVSAIVSLWVTIADYGMAGAQRTAVPMIQAKARGRFVWFEGHWGFQYYMQAAGFTPLDLKAMDTRPGDIVALAYNNTRIVGLPKSITGPTERFEIPQRAWASTIRQDVGAGFYASVFGPLPFVFGAIPPERYSLIEVKARY